MQHGETEVDEGTRLLRKDMNEFRQFPVKRKLDPSHAVSWSLHRNVSSDEASTHYTVQESVLWDNILEPLGLNPRSAGSFMSHFSATNLMCLGRGHFATLFSMHARRTFKSIHGNMTDLKGHRALACLHVVNKNPHTLLSKRFFLTLPQFILERHFV